MRCALLSMLLGLTLMQAASAQRIFPVLGVTEAVHELSLSDITMPRTTTGLVLFRPCPTCEEQTVPVAATTRYILDGTDLPLDEFRDAARRLRAAYRAEDLVGVGLAVDIDEQRVNRISIYTHFE